MIRGAIEQGNGRHLLDRTGNDGNLRFAGMDASRAEEEADKAIAALQVLPDSRGVKR
jgi:octaprenyl-diphosphate synthase